MCASELSDLRVVTVQDECGPIVECGDGGSPALGDVLELPVAIELVAEEVPQADGAWT